MHMPPSFAELLKGLSTEDLKELLEWDSSSTCNDLAVNLIKLELDKRATKTN